MSDDDHRVLARAAGAYVVLVEGEPALYLERGGRSIQTLPAFGSPAIAKTALGTLGDLVRDGRFRTLQIERIDGVRVADSPHRELLEEAGFRAGYRGFALSSTDW
jgi:ATP-dependent Lhr-like helicase